MRPGNEATTPVEQDPTTQNTESGDEHVAFIINPLHNDPIILTAADTTDSIESLLERKLNPLIKTPRID